MAERLHEAPVADVAPADTAPMIGRATLRSEDPRFLTGTGCYIDDMKIERMAHAVIVRSPIAHGRILSIDFDAARALPGVLDAFAFADIAAYAAPIPVRVGPLPGFDRFRQLPLASDVVRFVGEPVAVIVAESRYLAEDAAEQVFVDYEAFDAVVDVHRALEGTTIVHAGNATNLASHYTVSNGDPERAFREAAYTRKETFRCHRHSAMPLETRGMLAHWLADEQIMRVWGATKVPFANRRILAGMLKLPERQVELLEVDVGGSFGVRGDFYPEDFLIPFASMRLGRPVKWIEDRREHMMATNHAREMECELEIAVDADGRLLGMRARLLDDLGAYVRTNGGVSPAKAAQLLPGPYRIGHYACEVNALVTNKTPVGTYRGPGRYESAFYRERLLDLAAADLGIDPAEFRLRNMLTPDELPYDPGNLVPYMGRSLYDSGDYPLALQSALDAIDYPRLAARNGQLIDGRLHGVGIGCFVESTGGGPAESARFVLAGPRRIELYLGSSTSGQGHETVMAQVAADALGVPFDWFVVFHGSTTGVEQGFGTYHSRTAVMGSGAVVKAAEAFIEAFIELAAQRLGMPREQLAYRRGAVHRRDGAASAAVAGGSDANGEPADAAQRRTGQASGPALLSLSQIAPAAMDGAHGAGTADDADATGAAHTAHAAHAAHAAAAPGRTPSANTGSPTKRPTSPLDVTGTFENDTLTYTYGAQIAHVAVDPETCAVSVLRFVMVEDIGRALNPALVHGQAIGAAVQGIGGTFLDQYVYDESGQLTTGTFADYLLPTATDFPYIESITLEHARSPHNPLGTKGAGEGGIIGTGAALANAVSNALRPLGVSIRDLPISPNNLARWLDEAQAGTAHDTAPD